MNNISEIRKQKNISQAELAASLGVTQGSVSAWETGRWEPSIDALRQMAILFGVTIDELIGGTNDEGRV
ncbi:MAG: helix-turn-helix transcriptional regulator [Erysipelotrichaceae bacterium]|nr:helix-turn-helix transcriptional regulator [Erysipelotrichaceae bacterium]